MYRNQWSECAGIGGRNTSESVVGMVRITHPVRENLASKQVMCANCHKTSHADGHLRNYDRKDVHKLFDDFEPEKEVFAGVLQRRQSKASVWIAQKIGGFYSKPELFKCPYCESSQVKNSNRPIAYRKLASFFIKILNKPKKSIPYWIIVIYRKKNG